MGLCAWAGPARVAPWWRWLTTCTPPPDPVTATSPSRSVRSTVTPASDSSPSVRAEGWPYGLSAPTEAIATRAPTDRRKRGSWCALPWCGIFSTSARTSTPPASSASWASGSTSPVSSRVSPPLTTRSTIEELFGSESVPWKAVSGATTCHDRSPTPRRSPSTTRSSGTPAPAAQRRTRASSPAGSSSGPISTAPTRRPCSTAGRPSTWSACRCVRITSATASIPRSSRQRSIRSGSGPASTTTAVPAAAGSTRPSPWPTSHTTSRHPGGGHGVDTRCAAGSPTVKPASAATALRRTRPGLVSRGANATPAASTRASSSAPCQPAGQAITAAGSRAPTWATPSSHRQGHPASQAKTSASGIATGALAAASTPSTVAGPTAGSASRFAGTVTRLTWAASSTITGAVVTAAAAGIDSASASQSGSRRAHRSRQPGASSTSPAVASTDSANP